MGKVKVIDNLTGVRANARAWAGEFANLRPSARSLLIFEINSINNWFDSTASCSVWKKTLKLIKSIQLNNADNSTDRRELAILMLTTWAMTSKTLPESFFKQKCQSPARTEFAQNLWDEFHEFVSHPDPGRREWSYMDVVAVTKEIPVNKEQRELKATKTNAMADNPYQRPTSTKLTPEAKRKSSSTVTDATVSKKQKQGHATADDTAKPLVHVKADEDEKNCEIRRDNHSQCHLKQPQSQTKMADDKYSQQAIQQAAPGLQELNDACKRVGCLDEFNTFMSKFEMGCRQSENNQLAAKIAKVEAKNSEQMNDIAQLKRDKEAVEAENDRLKIVGMRLETTIAGMKTDATTLRSDIKSLMVENAKLIIQCNKYRSQWDEVKDLIGRLS